MPEISKDLIDDILDQLANSELAMRIHAEMAQSRANAPTDTITIKVPFKYAPHVAGAMSVGATTSMMCEESEGACEFQRAASDLLGAAVPDALRVFLHRSDRTKIFDLLAHGADIVFEREHSWRSPEIGFATTGRNGERRVRRFMLSREGEERMKDPEFAKSIHEGIVGLA